MAESNAMNLRDKLLEVARQLLINNGYRGFSLREVARETGVSATSIYLHFDSKDHLIHTLMGEAIDDLNGKLKKVYTTTQNPVKRLETFAEAYVDYALNHPHEYQIIYAVSSDGMSRYPKEKFREARKGYELLTDTIQEAVSKDILIEEDPRTAAYTFWAQLHGVMSVVLSKRLDTRINQQAFIEQAISHILQGFHVRTALQPQGNNI